MTERDPARRHRRRPAGAARRGRRRAARRHPRRHRGRLARGAAAAGGRGDASPRRSPSRTPASTGREPALAVDRQVRACTPAPGAWTTFEGERVKLGPVDPDRRSQLAPGELAGRQERRPRRHRHRTRCGSARSRRSARGRCPPPTGRAASGVAPGARFGDDEPCPATGAAEPAATSRRRRRDLPRPARDRARASRWGDRPTCKVPRGPEGQGLPALPGARHKTAVDPATGRAVRRPAGDHHPDRGREAGAGRGRRRTPFFTIDHFKGFNAVLVQQSRLGELEPRRAGARSSPTRGRAKAPKTLVEGLRRWLTPPAPPALEVLPRPSGPPTPTPTWPARRAARAAGSTGRDAAFATELVSGTLRRQGTYDAVLAACVDRPLAKVEAQRARRAAAGRPPAAGDAGARRTPRSAPPSTWCARGRRRGRPASPTRCCARSPSTTSTAWVGRVAPDAARTRSATLASRTRHPRWVVDEPARGASGSDELEALLAADNAPPRVTLVARPGRSTRDELPGEPTRWSPYGVLLERRRPGRGAGGAPRAGPGVQDEGSQLVALALAAAPRRRAATSGGSTCAPGPGGKAALLAALARRARRRGCSPPSGSRTAPRLVAPRARRRRRACSGVVTADGTRAAVAAPGSFDRVLVDAPCTGLGALRRRPEARWRRQPGDLDDAGAAPAGAAVGRARRRPPGRRGALRDLLAGRSPRPPASSRRCSRRGPTSCSRTPRACCPSVPDCAGPLPGTVQLWPHRHGTDAMFVALLRRARG